MAEFCGFVALDHAGLLPDLESTPAYMLTRKSVGDITTYTCTFCGVGDSGTVVPEKKSRDSEMPEPGKGTIRALLNGEHREFPCEFRENGRIEVATAQALVPKGGLINIEFGKNDSMVPVVGVDAGLIKGEDGLLCAHAFDLYVGSIKQKNLTVKERVPSPGCAKFNLSMGFHKPVFPYQVQPSLRFAQGGRTAVSYEQGINRFADLLLEHRPPAGRSLVYCCGQIDYFTIWSFQDVFRLLGIRSMTGNAEHCLNSGAVHNQTLTGQEGPFLTLEAATNVKGGFYLFNGWNGLITHPPAFNGILKRPDLDAYLVEVTVTESAKMLASKIGIERILMIKPGCDPHLALGVAHEILTNHPGAIEKRFIDRWGDQDSWEKYKALAMEERFEPAKVASRIAAEPKYEENIRKAIGDIAAKMADPARVPINIPSMGHSQSKGIVSHCLWGNAMAMLGKYGLKPDTSPAGGTLRIPGQINAQSEIQGLSRKYFFGRIPVTRENCVDACRRAGLPDFAYDLLLYDEPRAALDYSEPTPGEKELMICFGTQFESNMPGRRRWLEKLADPNVTLIVIDPIADPYTMENADLIIPPPPHSAVCKVMQNGEWRMFVSSPRKKALPETRSDPTIVYDTMAEISRRLREDDAVRKAHPDLAALSDSGYLAARFEAPEHGGGLPRLGGEVARAVLWQRVQDYLADGEDRKGQVYCRVVHDDGTPITWEELIEKGEVVYGGVGSSRYLLDYGDPLHEPFGDIFCRPGKFTFFGPTEEDLAVPEGPILVTGRGGLLDDKKRIRFAVSSFNSGKATTTVDMPDDNPLHISMEFAAQLGVSDGDTVKVTNRVNNESLELPVIVTDRVKGTTLYCSFHKSKAELNEGRYINDITDHVSRCPYTGQSRLKSTLVRVEAVLRTISRSDSSAGGG